MGEANITQLGQSSIDPDDYITVGGHPVLPLPGTRIYRWERWGVRRIPSSSIVDGNCCGIYDCLKDEFGPTNRAAPPYSPTGPNSNTFVKSLLSRCGLEFMPEPGQPRPGGAVGWGDPSY